MACLWELESNPRKSSHRETKVPKGRIKALERALEWGRVNRFKLEFFVLAHTP